MPSSALAIQQSSRSAGTGRCYPTHVHFLTGRDVHVWPVSLQRSDPVAGSLRALLSPDELSRVERFASENLQHSAILSRGILRVLLGRYAGVAPEDLRFSYGAKGKPCLRNSTPVEFNLAHSGALAVFAFTIGCEIGVDIEEIRTTTNMEGICARFFCAEEAGELLSLPELERERAFFLCWTRKEAYVKAIGEGFSAPLDSFRVTLRPDDPPRLIHVLRDTAAAEAWALHSLDVAAEYAGALAYRDSPRPLCLHPVLEPDQFLDLV